jgi:hypothetical protein
MSALERKHSVGLAPEPGSPSFARSSAAAAGGLAEAGRGMPQSAAGFQSSTQQPSLSIHAAHPIRRRFSVASNLGRSEAPHPPPSPLGYLAGNTAGGNSDIPTLQPALSSSGNLLLRTVSNSSTAHSGSLLEQRASTSVTGSGPLALVTQTTQDARCGSPLGRVGTSMSGTTGNPTAPSTSITGLRTSVPGIRRRRSDVGHGVLTPADTLESSHKPLPGSMRPSTSGDHRVPQAPHQGGKPAPVPVIPLGGSGSVTPSATGHTLGLTLLRSMGGSGDHSGHLISHASSSSAGTATGGGAGTALLGAVQGSAGALVTAGGSTLHGVAEAAIMFNNDYARRAAHHPTSPAVTGSGTSNNGVFILGHGNTASTQLQPHSSISGPLSGPLSSSIMSKGPLARLNTRKVRWL